MPKDRHQSTEISPAHDRDRHDSMLMLITRLYWFGLGPVFSLLLLYAIAQDDSGWLTAKDVIYLVLLTLLPLSRWLEFRTGNAQTSDGQPVTPAHLRNYSITVALVGILAWVVANVIGNHLFIG